ncbi:MAG: Fic family protein, partial [Acidimicrobiaceae bacterium]|nr:Fic family protein [Acidimicrobiaceae bacterium]
RYITQLAGGASAAADSVSSISCVDLLRRDGLAGGRQDDVRAMSGRCQEVEYGLEVSNIMGTMRNETPWVWAPLEGMPDGAEGWTLAGQADLESEWARLRAELKGDAAKERFVQGWLRERNRAFAIETGQIEGLYTLRRGVTEQLVAEGLSGVVGAHTYESLDDATIRGLLTDQEAALEMVFTDVAGGRALSESMIKSWHQLLTRHQQTVTGLDPTGRRVAVPFTTKGRWKIRPNNPRRGDGHVHQYCPPEQVPPEMERLLTLYADIAGSGYPVNVEAAWLHHRFVRTHPFQDGNGRVSRLLMAWAYLKRSLPPPIVSALGKPEYINALELADEGDLKAFSDYIGGLAVSSMINANQLARQAFAGRLNRPNGNGGRTVGDDYLSPLDPEVQA